MSKTTLKINGNTFIAVSEIKEIKPLTDEDRERLKTDLPHVDAAKFNTRIETSSRVRFAKEGIDDLDIALVEFVPGRYVPAANIESATVISKEEQAKLAADKRYNLKQAFTSRVELSSGKIKLSTISADRVMNNRNLALSLQNCTLGK